MHMWVWLHYSLLWFTRDICQQGWKSPVEPAKTLMLQSPRASLGLHVPRRKYPCMPETISVGPMGGCDLLEGCSMCWVSLPLTQAWTCPYHSPQLLQSSVNAISLLPMTYPWAQTYSSSSPISKPVWPCRMVWGKDGGSPQGLSGR